VSARARRALVLAGALAAAAGAPAEPPAPAQEPRVDYMLQCQGCHLADGSGSRGAVPDLRGVARLAVLPGGREYLARVPGAANALLSDARLAALLTWMLAEFGPPEAAAAAAPFRAGEVAAWRARPYADPGAARAALFVAPVSRARR
jgi:mono/diheme cytochrome c family protein